MKWRPATDRREARRGAVGLLAGEGRFPEVVAEAVRAHSRPLICVQLAGDSPALANRADLFVRLSPGQWNEFIGLFEMHGVTEVLIAGRFSRSELPARLAAGDELARAFLAAAPDRRDQPFLEGFARMLESRGLRVAEQTAYVEDLIAPPGLLAGPPPSKDEERDVALGIKVARVLAQEDVGQTIVLKGGVILAVEAAEGTDATIRRGGKMARGIVVCKVSRPHQDPRFDIPTLGPETLQVMEEVGGRVLAFEARRTILLDREDVTTSAARAGISLVAVDAPPLSNRLATTRGGSPRGDLHG